MWNLLVSWLPTLPAGKDLASWEIFDFRNFWQSYIRMYWTDFLICHDDNGYKKYLRVDNRSLALSLGNFCSSPRVNWVRGFPGKKWWWSFHSEDSFYTNTHKKYQKPKPTKQMNKCEIPSKTKGCHWKTITNSILWLWLFFTVPFDNLEPDFSCSAELN